MRVGITSFAQDALGDVVYVSLPAVGDTVSAGDSCGEVESTKSVSDLYAPLAGEVTAVNEALDGAPELVNADPYGEGWMYELRLADAGALDAPHGRRGLPRPARLTSARPHRVHPVRGGARWLWQVAATTSSRHLGLGPRLRTEGLDESRSSHD